MKICECFCGCKIKTNKDVCTMCDTGIHRTGKLYAIKSVRPIDTNTLKPTPKLKPRHIKSQKKC